MSDESYSAAPLDRIHSDFRRLVVRKPGDGLVVNLSAQSKFVLGSIEFKHTRLDLVDSKQTYYIENVDSLIDGLSIFIEENRFKFVFFLGSSKAGFASLMLTSNLSNNLPHVHFTAIVFSPQTSLWPRNPDIHYPSYKRLVDRAESGENKLKTLLEKYGTTPSSYNKKNLRWHIVYGAKNLVDTTAASLLSGPNITYDPLPTSTHSTILPFLCNTNNQEDVKKIVNSLERNAKKDADLGVDMLLERDNKLIAEIMQIPQRKSIEELIEFFYSHEKYKIPKNEFDK